MSKLRYYIKSFSPITFLLIASMTANILGWIFTLFANSMLSIEEMGHLALYVQIVTLVSIGSVSIGTTVNRFMADKSLQSNQISSWFALMALAAGITGSLIYLISAPWWQSYFQVSFNQSLLVGSSLLFTIMFLLAWSRGVIHAKQLYYFSGLVLLIESAVKLIFPFIRFNNMTLLSRFIYAQPVSAGIALVCLLALYLRYPHENLITFPIYVTRKIKLFIFHTIIQRASIIILISTDILLAKHFLSPQESGIYAIISLIGKMIFFATQSIYTIMTPLLAPHIADPVRRRRRYFAISALTSTVILLMILLFILAPNISLVPLIGSYRYSLIKPYVLKYSITSALFGMIFISSAYELLKTKYYYSTILLLAFVFEVILMQKFHASINEIVNNALLASVATLIISIFAAHSFKRRRKLHPTLT